MMQRYIALLSILVLMIFGFSYYKNIKSQTALFDKQVVDAIHTPQINPLFEKADAYKYAQDYRNANNEFKNVLKKQLSAADSQYVLNQLAYINLTINEDSVAEYWIRQIEKTSSPLSITAQADYSYNIGTWAYHTFKPKMAEAYLKKALESYQKIYGKEHLKTALCLTQLGMCFFEFEPTPDSSSIYLFQANEIYSKNILINQYSAECDLGLSQISFLKFENDKALSYIDKALSKLKSNENNLYELRLRCLSQKGNVHQKIGFLERDSSQRSKHFLLADSYLKQALSEGRNKITVRHQDYFKNMLVFKAKMKDSVEFHSYFNELTALLKVQGNYYGNPERLKGLYFKNVNNTDSSIFHYHNFWAHHHSDSLKQFILLEVSNALSLLYEKKLNFDSALYYAKQNILVATSLNNSTDLSWNFILSPNVYKKNKYIFVSYFLIAQTLNEKYKYDKDIKALNQAFEISKLTDENLFQNIFSTEEESVLSYQREYGEQSYTQALSTAYLLYQKTPKKEYLNYAFRFAERLKSILLYRNIADEKSIVKPSNTITDSIKELNYQISQSKWQRDYLGNNSSDIELLESQLKNIYSRIEKDYPDFFKRKTQQIIPSIDTILKSLKGHQLFLHYTLCPKKWYRFAFSPTKIDFQEFDSTEILIKQISEVKSVLKDKNNIASASNYYDLASHLYDKLCSGLKAQLKTSNNLIIVQDRQLSGLPFEALTPSVNQVEIAKLSYKTLPYLVYSHSIEYSSSWKIFQNTLFEKISPNPKMAFFSYDFKTKELPYSNIELNALQKNLSKNIDLYIGNDCNKKTFLEKMNIYDIIHLSLHASSDPSNKFNNKIFFKSQNQDTLYGFELIRGKCTAQLLILSACETAEGKIEAGEGVFSLSRYFQQCGVKNIIASFWKIDDATSAQLLSNFYDNLLPQMQVAQTLQKAKIAYLKNANNPMSSPKYWAGLVNLK